MNSESGNGVIEDLENGIISLVAIKETARWDLQVTRQVSPLSTANGTGDSSMADIGGDTIEMKSMRALSCKYSLPWSSACAVVQSFQTYCTHGLGR